MVNRFSSVCIYQSIYLSILVHKYLPLSQCIHIYLSIYLSKLSIEKLYFPMLKNLSRTASFRHYMKWACKALCVAITDSPVFKKRFNNKRSVCSSPSYDHNWKKRYQIDESTIASCLVSRASWQFKIWGVFWRASWQFKIWGVFWRTLCICTFYM